MLKAQVETLTSESIAQKHSLLSLYSDMKAIKMASKSTTSKPSYATVTAANGVCRDFPGIALLILTPLHFLMINHLGISSQICCLLNSSSVFSI